jgi:hypothetical protein
MGTPALENIWKADVFPYIPMENTRAQNIDDSSQHGTGVPKND